MLRRLGSSWGFGALLKGTSVVVLKVEDSAVYSLPPPTIPAGPETRTPRPLESDCLTIRPRLPPWPNDLQFAVWSDSAKKFYVWNHELTVICIFAL